MAKSAPLLVAIVGGSGSGKSWLAKKLHAALDPDAVRLSLDDFYRDRSHLHPVRRAKLNFDNPRAIDWLTVEKALADLRAGSEACLPTYNFKTHCRLADENTLAPKPVVIMEGLWLLHHASVREVFGVKIFIECPARMRRSRRLARDLRSRGRSRASILEQLRSTVEPMYARFVAPQQKWADIILRHDFSEGDVRRLAHELRERLKASRPSRTINGE
jgi:uridine kinase